MDTGYVVPAARGTNRVTFQDRMDRRMLCPMWPDDQTRRGDRYAVRLVVRSLGERLDAGAVRARNERVAVE